MKDIISLYGLDVDELDDNFWAKLYRLTTGKKLIGVGYNGWPTISWNGDRTAWIPVTKEYEEQVREYIARMDSQNKGRENSLEQIKSEATAVGIVL